MNPKWNLNLRLVDSSVFFFNVMIDCVSVHTECMPFHFEALGMRKVTQNATWTTNENCFGHANPGDARP